LDVVYAGVAVLAFAAVASRSYPLVVKAGSVRNTTTEEWWTSTGNKTGNELSETVRLAGVQNPMNLGAFT
jgi:hypothetical protein